MDTQEVELKKEHENNDTESFEILELAESQMNVLKRIFSDISKTSAAKQTMIGGAAGAFSGYLMGRVGRVALLLTGGTLLLLQVGHHKGYVTLNWGQIERDVRNAERKLRKKTKNSFRSYGDSAIEFMKQNMFISGGFAAGFFVGLSV